MQIPPASIVQSGSGVDLSNQPGEVTVRMSDPIQDLDYARNALTLTYDLAGCTGVRLRFEALEYGDEPHEPPTAPFGDDVNFDGVAVSVDGVQWYEIQGLRNLRSDRFTAFDIDVDAAILAQGLTYNGTFRVRFCQYDNNPAPMDGFTISGIELDGTPPPPFLHLTMNDNAPSTTVLDSASGAHHQAFIDPGGNPNTSAHSVAGRVGAALSFDGVDDKIDLGVTVDGVLAAGHNFAVAFWWARGGGNVQADGYIFKKLGAARHINANNHWNATTGQPFTTFYVYRQESPVDRTLFTAENVGYEWNHYVLQRRGTTFELWVNGALVKSDATAGNDGDFSGPSGFRLGSMGTSGFGQGVMDDFRVYGRALLPEEIEALQI